jgi:anthranilate 1,2-dioxygenase small subunit
MSTVEQTVAVQQLLTDAFDLLDRGELDLWTDLFAEDGRYVVTTRENLTQALPGHLLGCENKDQIRDRIFYLLRGSAYAQFQSRHFWTPVLLSKEADGTFSSRSNFVVFNTNQDGESGLYVVGAYSDRIAFEDGRPKLKERIAILDTAAVPTQLAIPV